MVILKILIALMAFSFIVCVHEIFHFLAAKLVKAPINDFSVGMGKAFLSYQNGKFYIWDKHKGEPKDKTQLSYNLRILPLGGYVAFESFEGKEEVKLSESEYYTKVSPWKRIIISAAGPLGNFVLAFLLMFYFTIPLTGLFTTQGEIKEIETSGWAYEHGIRAGDVINTVNGIEMTNSATDREAISQSINEQNKICVEYSTDGYDKYICDIPSEGKTTLGTSFDFSVWESIVYNAETIKTFTVETVKSLVNLIANFDVKEMSGPIGTVDVMQQTVADMDKFILVLVLINISLAIFNLIFPISSVDGGKIVIDFICILFRKKYLNTKVLDFISILVILSLFIYTGVLDIQRIIERIFG